MVLSSAIVCDHDRRIADDRRPYCDLRSYGNQPLLHIVHFRTCSSPSLRLSEESKEPEEFKDSEEIEEDLEDSDDSEMNYIFEIEMDAYRQEASASANSFDNSDLEEDLF